MDGSVIGYQDDWNPSVLMLWGAKLIGSSPCLTAHMKGLARPSPVISTWSLKQEVRLKKMHLYSAVQSSHIIATTLLQVRSSMQPADILWKHCASQVLAKHLK